MKKKYRELQDELDQLLASFNAGGMDIDESIDAYERAVALIGELEAYLEKAENHITRIGTKLSRAE